MLLANILVAEFIMSYCKEKTLLRAHPDIDVVKKEELYAFFRAAGFGLEEIDLSTSGTLNKSLSKIRE